MYKYKRNGFTLVELMAVIIIISLIVLLTFPNIINQIKKTKKSNNKMIEDVVIEQAKKYVSDNPDEFQDDDGYCLSIDTLVDKGYVNEQLVGINNKDNDVIMMIKKGDFSYKIVNKNDCDVSEYQNIFVDNEGKKYERVEYLESTGTQYINTGIVPTSNTRIQAGITLQGGIGSLWPIYGSRTNNYTNNFIGFGTTSYTFRSSTGGDGYTDTNINVDLRNDIHLLDVKVREANVDGFSFTNSANLNYNSSAIPIYLFALNDNGSIDRYSKVKMYSFKIYEDIQLVRDFIPALDTNDIPCLFDKVSKDCFYNQGTGDFIISDNYKKNNYIESTGTQYINTGIVPTSNTRIQAGITLQGGIGSLWPIYGSRTNNYTNNFIGFGTTSYTFRSSTGGDGYTDTNINVDLRNDIHLLDVKVREANVDGFSFTNSANLNYNSSAIPIYLFALNDNGSIDRYSKVKMYSFKIYEGDVLQRDYIPALDSKGVACLYDKVEKKYYYNQGTGEFLYG